MSKKKRKVTEDKLRRAERLRATSVEPTWEGNQHEFRTDWPNWPKRDSR